MAEKAVHTDHYSDYVDTSKISDTTYRQQVECVLEMFWSIPELKDRFRQGFENSNKHKVVLTDITGYPFKYHHSHNVTTIPQLPLGKGGLDDAMYPVIGGGYHDMSLNRAIGHEVLGHWASDQFLKEANITNSDILQKTLADQYRATQGATASISPEAALMVELQHQLDIIAVRIGQNPTYFRSMQQGILPKFEQAKAAVLNQLNMDEASLVKHMVDTKLEIVKDAETRTITFMNKIMGDYFGEPPRDPDQYESGVKNADSPQLDMVGFAPGKTPTGYQATCPFIPNKQAKLDVEAIRNSQTVAVALVDEDAAQIAAPSKNSKLGIV